MATLNFTIDEALNIVSANVSFPESIKSIKAQPNGLLLTVTGGIDILLGRESCHSGILKLAISSKNWAFKLADSMGKVDGMLDEAIRSFPFIRRQGKSLSIDLNRALQTKVKGIQVKNFEIREGSIKIDF
jgi:hypothetical protein